jgi:hypothetical protein
VVSESDSRVVNELPLWCQRVTVVVSESYCYGVRE